MPFRIHRAKDDDPEAVDVKPEDILGTETVNRINRIDEVAATQATQGDDLQAIKATLLRLAEGRPTGRGTNGTENENEEEPAVNPALAMSTLALENSYKATVSSLKREMSDEMTSENKLKFPYWSQFLPEIEKLTEGDALARKQSKAYWENAYLIIVGRNLEKIQNGTIKATGRIFIENGATNTSNPPVQKADDVPSEIDIRQAAKFKIPIDKYMKSKKELRFA